MKRIFYTLVISSIFLLSGCTNPLDIWNTNEIIEKDIIDIPIIQLEGILTRPDTSFFSSGFTLVNNDGQIIATIENSKKDIKNIKNDTHIVLKGLWNKEDQMNKTELILELIDIYEIDTEETLYQSKFGIKFPIDTLTSIKHTDEKERFIRNGEDWFLIQIQENKTAIEQFIREGEKVVFGDLDGFRRIYPDGELKFYFPSLGVEMEYRGENKNLPNLPIFYALLENIEISEYIPEIENINLEDGIAQKTIEPTSDILISSTPLSNISPSEIQNNKLPISSLQILLSNTKEIFELTDNRSIEIFFVSFKDEFIEITYTLSPQEKTSDAVLMKTLFSLEPSFRKIASFTEGNKTLWEKISGDIPETLQNDKFFMSDIDQGRIKEIPEDFRQYLNLEKQFSIAYPEHWRIKPPKQKSIDLKEEDGMTIVAFHLSSLENDIIPLAVVSQKEGKITEIKEDFSSLSISIPYDELYHLELKISDKQKFALLQEIAYSITVY